ncbi:MAG: Gfo/Idh/MocA family oxidoreductase, partial [Terriglobia bacterium]
MSNLGVAVIGAGKLGQRHAENLRYAVPQARLAAIADSDLHRASEVAAALDVEFYSDDAGVAINRKDVQAVVIASPSKFHAGTIQLAAQAGKHIFCEKPVALTPQEARAALAAVDHAGVQLQVGFMRRYDPAYAAAKQRIDAGEIGQPVMFKSLGRDRQPPPLSFFRGGVNGSLFSDAAIHDFDLARWLMSDEVIEAHSYAGLLACPELAEFGDIDACLVNLRFSRGGIGNVEAFRKANYGYDIRTEITGERGTIQIGYLQANAEIALTSSGPTYEIVG